MPNEERFRQLTLFSLERRRLRTNLMLAFKTNVKVTLIRLISSCAHPIRPQRAYLPITARTKPSSTQARCLFCSCREILEQIGGTSTIVTLSIYLQKQLDRQWSEMFPAAPVQILFPFIEIFLDTVTPYYLCFPYPQTLTSLCGYY